MAVLFANGTQADLCPNDVPSAQTAAEQGWLAAQQYGLPSATWAVVQGLMAWASLHSVSYTHLRAHETEADL
eukprot:336908-Rhodomonas_salina.1